MKYLLEQLSTSLIEAFKQRAKYTLPALMQATLDVEFLAQTLNNYTTDRASEVQSAIYIALDERTDNEARLKLQEELQEMRAILKRLRESTKIELYVVHPLLFHPPQFVLSVTDLFQCVFQEAKKSRSQHWRDRFERGRSDLIKSRRIISRRLARLATSHQYLRISEPGCNFRHPGPQDILDIRETSLLNDRDHLRTIHHSDESKKRANDCSDQQMQDPISCP